MADSRSKKRLLMVTVVLLAIVGGMIYFSADQSVAYYKPIGEVTKDPSYIGKSIKVGGEVVEKSVVHDGNITTFKIFDKAHKGDQLTIVYTGQLPNPFGGGIFAIVDGKLVSKDTVEATRMVTRCPSKYDSKKGGN